MMVTGRPLWLLDEPTVSLDTHACDLFVAMLARHLEMGGGALVATHITIDLASARLLDLTPYRADPTTQAPDGFDEAFLLLRFFGEICGWRCGLAVALGWGLRSFLSWRCWFHWVSGPSPRPWRALRQAFVGWQPF